MNRPALIVVHPGDELVMLGWREANHSPVAIFTDGSGRDGVSRLPSTLRPLHEVGAAAILDGNVELFVDLADRHDLGEMIVAPAILDDEQLRRKIAAGPLNGMNERQRAIRYREHVEPFECVLAAL